MTISDSLVHPQGQSQLEAFAKAPAHAALLSGPEGIGKTHIAASLSARLLNLSPAQLESYAYYRVVAPKNNTITIEQIRELIGFFRLKVPGVAIIKRVATLQDTDSMGIEAQNALLKLLEEPPTDSVLLLTSSYPVRLLPTVRSRVQHLQLPAPAAAEVQQHLVAAGYAETTVKAVLLRTGTNIAAAKQMLEAGEDMSDGSIALVKQALSTSLYERLLLVDGLSKQKDQARSFAGDLAVVASASLESAAIKGAATMPRWHAILQAAYTAQDALERSGNTKLVLTELMLAL